MPENFENIGLFYQKFYFKGITFDPDGNYKNSVNESRIADRNQTLLRYARIHKAYFYSASNDNSIQLKSIYPGIITGIGMKHETAIEGELKLGMYFDHSSGMPCIPGSSVKGALRSAFPQYRLHKETISEIKTAKSLIICKMLHKINPGLLNTPKKSYSEYNEHDFQIISRIEEEIFDGKNFNPDRKDEKGKMKPMLSVYEKDIFHDAFITEHSNGKILGDDAITHHPDPLKNPVPVIFMKILSGVKIQFNFDLKDGVYLNKMQKWGLLKAILTYYGIGAKTNVGYGQFEPA